MKKLVFYFAPLLICSCIGVSADITLHKDGSGKIVMEYRVSHMAEAIGRLDGNERWQTVPTGRADFERSLSRLPGMKLVSFSTSEAPSPAGKDLLNRAEMEFKDTATLLAFLDPKGKRSSVTQSGGKTRLSLVLLESPVPKQSPELLELLRQVSKGYEVKISLNTGENTAIGFTNGNGVAAAAPSKAAVSSPGKTVSFFIETFEIVRLEDGLGVYFDW